MGGKEGNREYGWVFLVMASFWEREVCMARDLAMVSLGEGRVNVR